VKDETRIVGNLPNLRMEIVHRQDPDGAAEHMIIHLSATPSFQAAESLLLGGLSPQAWANPMALWSNLAQAWLAPWTAMLGGNGNPWLDAISRRDSR
jgi:hypothetical protein